MLQRTAEDLWTFDQDLRLAGGLVFPSRTVIFRTKSGSLVVHSPVAFDDAAVAQIDALGEVSALVAPSNVHYLYLASATKHWPRAKVYGSEGLEKKVPDIAFEPLPGEGTIDGLATRRIEGAPYMNEQVFFHEPSRTVVVTDLLFNIQRCPFTTQMFLRMAAAYGGLAQSRVFRLFTKDRTAARKSVDAMLEWNFDRLIPSHGDAVDTDARDRARAALS